MLRRAGLLESDRQLATYWKFSQNGKHTCDVFAMTGLMPDRLAFAIVLPVEGLSILKMIRQLRTVDLSEFRHIQHVHLSYTACNYGKRRTWMHCPTCKRRVFRLFYYDNTYSNGQQVHYFACRHCYGLTYQQRRSRGFDRYQDRAMSIQRNLIKRGAPNDDFLSWEYLPDKPKGMHWRTYQRYVDKFEQACALAENEFGVALVRLIREQDKSKK